MAIQQKSFSVQGDDYLLTHFAAGKGIRVLKLITKLAGPAFAAASAPSQSGNAFSGIVTAILENLDNVDVEALARGMIESVSKGSVAINFDTEFAGAYDKLFLILQEVVEFNFGSVFTLFGSEGQ